MLGLKLNHVSKRGPRPEWANLCVYEWIDISHSTQWSRIWSFVRNLFYNWNVNSLGEFDSYLNGYNIRGLRYNNDDHTRSWTMFIKEHQSEACRYSGKGYKKHGNKKHLTFYRIIENAITHVYVIWMAWCKTAVSPLLTHWRYCSLALSLRFNASHYWTVTSNACLREPAVTMTDRSK